MPQARPLKRPSDAGDAAAPEGSPGPKVKLPRLERGAEDFSSVVKSKLQSYTRTGQACDRCKVRKIRCDALAEGCSHCTNQNLECYVTDRVTGRTERRGYLQQLEREKNAMLNHIRELEKLLLGQGIEVRPWEWPNYNTTYPPGVGFDALGNPVQDPASGPPWQQVGSLWIKGEAGERKAQQGSGLIARHPQLESRPTGSYLGVSSDSAPLSSIKGTTLSILGTTIDIASFDAPDMDEPPPGTPIRSPLYNKSVMAFLQSVLGVNPQLDNVDLPSRADAFTYAEWYFLTLSPYLPILHKPSFLQLLTRIYDDPSFKPTTSELVIVHMVFATIYFQYGIRNRQEPEKHAQLNDFSNKHYHWSLSKFFDLAISQTVSSVQALAMITAHTRNFPKPGCSSTIAHFALMKAIELNLHRGVKMPDGQTTLDIEIRKRTFWSILAVMVTLNGRLGRPMPITPQEFDVDFPIPIPDEYLSEEGISDPSKIGQCDYIVGIVAYKSVPLYIEMFSSIYSVRRDPQKYVAVVRELEAKMQDFINNLPEQLELEQAKDSTKVFALYTQAIIHEFSLCLRHPSVCMTNDSKFCAENTRICEESASKLLKVVSAILKKKSLDTTWYQLAVYIAAIFSTLVAHWERRFTTTLGDVATLRTDMAAWLEVIAEIGRLLGTGARLADDVSTIIDRTINWIEDDMSPKGTPPQALIKQPTSPFQGKTENSSTPAPDAAAEPRTNGTFYDSTGTPTSYPPLNYDPAGGAVMHPTFNAADGNQYPYPNGPGTAVTTTAVDPATSATNPLIAFASQATQHVAAGQAAEDWRPQTQLMSQASGNVWHDWTAAIADSQDRYGASTLLTLGSTREVAADQVNQEVMAPANSHSGQWPLLLFHEGTGQQ
ncbi:hypothetical protein OQA88_7699 [Cercophora sp. LCS_1]